MTKFKCVIFDCDGVLVDSEPIGNKVIVEMANELGANINLPYAIENFKGHSLEYCFNEIAIITDSVIPLNFESEYRRRSFEAFKSDIQPVNGIKDVLETISIPFCVASSGPPNKIQLNLELTGLLPYFEGKIFSCYTLKKWKPSPAVFLWAAKKMGFKPHDCLVIEDSIIGVEAAKRGGFPVYGFTARDTKEQLKNQADLVFNHMSELVNLL